MQRAYSPKSLSEAWDCSVRKIYAMIEDGDLKAFSIGNWDSERISLHLPYLHEDKIASLKDADEASKKLGLDFDTVFRNTCTSYQPDKEGKSHGLTGSNVERIIAFHRFGRKDPVDYVGTWDEVVAKALKMEKRFLEESFIQP